MSNGSAKSAGDLIQRTESLAERLAFRIREEITAGRFKVGERLPTEQAIAETYGVSRPIVREAIGRLKHDGLVISRQGAGAFVQQVKSTTVFRFEVMDFSDKIEIGNIIELLITIETTASENAARRRSEEQLANIKRRLDDMQEAIERQEAGVEEDLAFHRAIVEATGNPFFIDLSNFFDTNVRHFIRTARSNSARSVGLSEAAQNEHRTIYEAIRDKDAQAAHDAAKLHLLNAAKRLNIYLARD